MDYTNVLGRLFGNWLRGKSCEPEKAPEGRSREDIMREFVYYTIPMVHPAIRESERVSLYFISHEYPEGSEIRDNMESLLFAEGVARGLEEAGIEGVKPTKISLKYKTTNGAFRIGEVGGVDQSVYSGAHNILVDDFCRIVGTETPIDDVDGEINRTLERAFLESLSIFYAYPSPRPRCMDVYRVVNVRSLRDTRAMLRRKAPDYGKLSVPNDYDMPEKYSGILHRTDTILTFAENMEMWDDELETAFEGDAQEVRRLARVRAISAHIDTFDFRNHWRRLRDRKRKLKKRCYRGAAAGESE